MVKESLTPAEIKKGIEDLKSEIVETTLRVAGRTGFLRQRTERRLAEAQEDLVYLEGLQSQGS